MLIMKNGKPQMTEGMDLPTRKKSECMEKRKLSSTWEYWKHIQTNKWRWKKNLERVSQENEKTTRSQGTEKTVEHESGGDTKCTWCSQYTHQVIGTGTEDLEIIRRVKIIQTTALLRLTRILRRVLETLKDLVSLKLQWKPSANANVKNSQ